MSQDNTAAIQDRLITAFGIPEKNIALLDYSTGAKAVMIVNPYLQNGSWSHDPKLRTRQNFTTPNIGINPKPVERLKQFFTIATSAWDLYPPPFRDVLLETVSHGHPKNDQTTAPTWFMLNDNQNDEHHKLWTAISEYWYKSRWDDKDTFSYPMDDKNWGSAKQLLKRDVSAYWYASVIDPNTYEEMVLNGQDPLRDWITAATVSLSKDIITLRTPPSAIPTNISEIEITQERIRALQDTAEILKKGQTQHSLLFKWYLTNDDNIMVAVNNTTIKPTGHPSISFDCEKAVDTEIIKTAEENKEKIEKILDETGIKYSKNKKTDEEGLVTYQIPEQYNLIRTLDFVLEHKKIHTVRSSKLLQTFNSSDDFSQFIDKKIKNITIPEPVYETPYPQAAELIEVLTQAKERLEAARFTR